MINILLKTPSEIDLELAERMAGIRKRRKITQAELAKKAGVSLGSLRRFEQTGEISLHSLTLLSIALSLEDELEALFRQPEFLSIDEVIRGQD